jgi:hypothetical protein
VNELEATAYQARRSVAKLDDQQRDGRCLATLVNHECNRVIVHHVYMHLRRRPALQRLSELIKIRVVLGCPNLAPTDMPGRSDDVC